MFSCALAAMVRPERRFLVLLPPRTPLEGGIALAAMALATLAYARTSLGARRPVPNSLREFRAGKERATLRSRPNPINFVN